MVDDDPAIRKLIRLILEPSGYDILVAEDGKDAINVLRSGENPMVIDTIITDLNMPNIDGFEAIVYFQKEFASIPIIVLTGIADVELAVSFMQRGIQRLFSETGWCGTVKGLGSARYSENVNLRGPRKGFNKTQYHDSRDVCVSTHLIY